MNEREIRARFDNETVTVYQAYGHEIADRALAAGTFVAPFKPDRMTWIKPSFLWMMYRSGWATKSQQERVLAIDITHDGLRWALENSCLSHYSDRVHSSHEAWRAQLAASPVRVQWDPERDLWLRPQPHRAIQIGLGPEASRRYVDEWIVRIRDVTPLAHEIHALVQAGDTTTATTRLPHERPLLSLGRGAYRGLEIPRA
ncbi:protein of unknown function (DUF4291) [Streptoalloteichus tenebrarius]|uniref:DUF4291 domain-containing protein n=1 Tax=Streptoalloteichus tenebrarius (strain ATCC 17920 / DSM 40477 / JCM 4838 / CBS 697.72 / NBRC 16177 / NCIMB 11028 / NRRL B-12390 / A12253. 1 / ISP 5477) TaxID=1933 RepID=A0ABT1HY17_STRSD|nr:DUF4291 domain-containing protein [Streptoalloteichus tenebrarius]MCP2260410.1 protein of unknown function (DUF4291) [Streptoalloteichus tenebrarius]BFF02482.1 DUF4291 domain-containing protein [Streptoalloteichus tenebrarius]